MILAIGEDTQNCKSSQTQSIPTEADECQTELTAEDLKKQSTGLENATMKANELKQQLHAVHLTEESFQAMMRKQNFTQDCQHLLC